jgi:phosphoglycerate dehydrogenase-like enzyme
MSQMSSPAAGPAGSKPQTGPTAIAQGRGLAPLTLLLSRPAANEVAVRIGEVLGDRPFRLVHLEDGPDAIGNYPVDIAFLSRDVTSDSGKTILAPTLTRFYEILRASPRLQWLQMHAAGADRPIYAEMRRRGVIVTTASGANAGPVAQMAVTGLLALARCLPALLDAQRRHAWEPLLGSRAPRDLRGQTAVIVGLGPIGQEVARLLGALEMRRIGVRRSAAPFAGVDETVDFGALDRVLPRADWVVLACPLSDQTRGLMSAERLRSLPRGARIINVSRGEVVVEQALIEALVSGHLGGAYVDVLVKEPLDSSSPIWDLPNFIVTPHTAGHTAGHSSAVESIFLDNLSRWRDGLALRNVLMAPATASER